LGEGKGPRAALLLVGWEVGEGEDWVKVRARVLRFFLLGGRREPRPLRVLALRFHHGSAFARVGGGARAQHANQVGSTRGSGERVLLPLQPVVLVKGSERGPSTDPAHTYHM